MWQTLSGGLPKTGCSQLLRYWEGDQLTWTNLKPRFQNQFATQTDDKLLIDGLSNLAMKPNKSTSELPAQITKTMGIIKDSFAAYCNKVPASNHNANRGYLDATATKWRNNSVNNAFHFFKMQLFWVALPGEIHHLIAQKDPTEVTLDNIYLAATTVQQETGSKTFKTVAAVNKESDFKEDKDKKVAAFQNRRGQRGNRVSRSKKYTYRTNRTGNRPGNNFNCNRKYCF
jgi:hypothetical protein